MTVTLVAWLDLFYRTKQCGEIILSISGGKYVNLRRNYTKL
ncbi:uncharacterized protein METZ01_LOCUS496747 [marine metagenome]|uniref:Uncharacterized protein n=1 Tax=marine metagenome TaxID=408172 RepID=A0A383DHV1_9ZZZZ